MTLRQSPTFNARFASGLTASALALGAFLSPTAAVADIKNPSDHPNYKVELEPQVLFRALNDDGFGVGFRASIELADPAFVPSISNTVAITFGGGFVFNDWDHCHNGFCHDHNRNHLILPVACQWNFWFTDVWSAFAELGLAAQIWDNDYDHRDGRNYHRDDYDDFDVDPAIFIGGRAKLTDNIALTLRLGHPTFSFGVSIFL